MSHAQKFYNQLRKYIQKCMNDIEIGKRNPYWTVILENWWSLCILNESIKLWQSYLEFHQQLQCSMATSEPPHTHNWIETTITTQTRYKENILISSDSRQTRAEKQIYSLLILTYQHIITLRVSSVFLDDTQTEYLMTFWYFLNVINSGINLLNLGELPLHHGT